MTVHTPEIPAAHYEETAAWLTERIETPPRVALILGSGLGSLADHAVDKQVFGYEEIPHFPTVSIEGHAGNLVIGQLGDKPVIAMQGRFHYYEGWTMNQLTYPLRVFAKMGVEKLVVTNSAGGINPDFQPGDLMLIRDHINMMGLNPLRGPNLDSFGTRFPDMSEPYSRRLRRIAVSVATDDLDYYLHTGVYAAVSGPSYETPAEIRMLRRLGADAVGMSTVPEVIVANHSGLEVVGISCITNMAAGMTEGSLSHGEVKEVAGKVHQRFSSLLTRLLERIDEERPLP